MPHSTNLPPIIITSEDYDQLEKIAPTFSAQVPENRLTLSDELDRATIVERTQVPSNVVTMNSRVEFQFGEEPSTRRTVTLVFPGEQDIAEGKISVHTPVGTALIGLVEGQSIEWETRRGDLKRLTITRVVYQPEADARSRVEDLELDSATLRT